MRTLPRGRRMRLMKVRIGRLLEVIRDGSVVDVDSRCAVESHPVRLPRKSGRNCRAWTTSTRCDRTWKSPEQRIFCGRSTTRDVWLLLAGLRGWTPGQFEHWLAETTCAQLLNR